MDDIMAMSAMMTRKMEKVAETGSKILTSGLNFIQYSKRERKYFYFKGKEAMNDVSASVKASTEKVSDVFNR